MSRKITRPRAAAPAPHAVASRVRQLRTKLELSVRGLAARTGFSPSFISQLENGAVSPSLGSLEKIAHALGVSLHDLFLAAGDAPPPIVKRGERPGAWSRARVEALGIAGRKLAATMIVLEPQGRSGKHPRAPRKEEYAFVAEGRVVLTLARKTHALRKGDSAIIPAGALRLWMNVAARPARVLIVSTL